MPLLPEDEGHLARALMLAEQNAAFASPNPTVGCVLVRNGIVLGEGAHRYDARDHAEIVALKQAAERGQNVRGATAYVTLEPCSHHGRTGPCADALIHAGITRCVAATIDPNPAVSGTGIARMRAAGIDVVVLTDASPLAHQARELNDAFAFSVRHHRPFVTLKTAVSLDGMIAPPTTMRASTGPVWLTSTAARADVQRLRHASDAGLTGIGTVLADDPLLTDRSGLPRWRKLLRIVLDASLRTPLDSQLLQTANDDLLLVIADTIAADREQIYEAAGAGTLRVAHSSGPASALDLAAVLAELDTRGIRSLFLECGSQLNAAWLRSGLVDRVILYIADVELGPDAVPFAAGWGSPYTLQQQMHRIQRATFPSDRAAHDDVRVEGYLHDPWE